jgi:hypothetical protein
MARAKGLLPLPGSLAGFAQFRLGWARYERPAYYGDGETSGLAWGADLGLEAPVVGLLRWVAAIRYDGVPTDEIAPTHGYLRYRSVSVVTGPEVRF